MKHRLDQIEQKSHLYFSTDGKLLETFFCVVTRYFWVTVKPFFQRPPLLSLSPFPNRLAVHLLQDLHMSLQKSASTTALLRTGPSPFLLLALSTFGPRGLKEKEHVSQVRRR